MGHFSDARHDLTWLKVATEVRTPKIQYGANIGDFNEFRPAAHSYDSPVLVIDAGLVKVSFEATNEQLASIRDAIDRHLHSIRYHETPDQQLILNAELNRAIEEGESA